MNPKHKSLLFKEWSCLGWTRFKFIQFIVVTVSVLTPLKFQIVHNFVNEIIIMADRVAQKDMGKRFRLSTEVRATLQRKHDRWTPYRAYSRVEKELSFFGALCKILLSFFQMPAATTTENDEVGCNGRAVKMFADLIKRSLKGMRILWHVSARRLMLFFFLLSYSLSFNGTICK